MADQLSCTVCAGRGEIAVDLMQFGRAPRSVFIPCDHCRGWGVEPCSCCGGDAVQEYEGEYYCEVCWRTCVADLAEQVRLEEEAVRLERASREGGRDSLSPESR